MGNVTLLLSKGAAFFVGGTQRAAWTPFIMTDHSDDLAHAREMLSDAMFAYRAMARELRATIERLSESALDPDEARKRNEILKSHQRQLFQVIEMEADLARRSKTDRGTRPARSEIDLDAARDEIRQRLSRLAQARGD